MSTQKKRRGYIPESLEIRAQLSQQKARGFRRLKRALENANLTKREADDINHCLGPT